LAAANVAVAHLAEEQDVLVTMLAIYAAVLTAELVGDKTLYTLGPLSSRYGFSPVLAGATVACMGKMAAAVLLGEILGRLPAWVIAATSGVTFFWMAFLLYRRKPATESARQPGGQHWWQGALAGFASSFFSEWADVGQITAAVLAAQLKMPLVVWTSATLAVVTKSLFSATVGLGLRRWVPDGPLRVLSVCVYLVMGTLAILRID
jgi:putative Ca2+/H+ antiporter (TMEM165/GDT1 family)